MYFNKIPSISIIRNRLSECIHTNVIVLSTPICNTYFSKCHSFNSRLSNLVYNFSRFSMNKVVFLDSCDCLGRKYTNRRLSGEITNIINFSVCKNLIHIKPDDATNELSHGITIETGNVIIESDVMVNNDLRNETCISFSQNNACSPPLTSLTLSEANFCQGGDRIFTT